MKKLMIFIILLCSLIFIETANATSGACSWHDGVNCSAGPGLAGNAVCNDGWTESSVRYIDACKGIDQYQIAINYCNIFDVDYSGFKYEEEYYKIFNDCLKNVSSDESWQNQISEIANCPEKGRYKTANKLEEYCNNIIEKRKNNDKDSRIKLINIYSSANKKNLLIKNIYSDIGKPIESAAFYIDWSQNDVSDIEGFYFSLNKAQTLSNELSNFEYTKNNGASIFNIENGNYNLYFKLKYKDGYISPVKYIFSLNVKNNKISSNIDFIKKQKGKILLQVESHGEAWYVNPKDGKRYYMADGNKAYDVMRNMGVGITNKDLDKIKANKTLAKKSSGKIFLQIESKGEAYYIDFDGVAHYLKDGAAAYEIMRSLGVGITNNDLTKITQ